MTFFRALLNSEENVILEIPVTPRVSKTDDTDMVQYRVQNVYGNRFVCIPVDIKHHDVYGEFQNDILDVESMIRDGAIILYVDGEKINPVEYSRKMHQISIDALMHPEKENPYRSGTAEHVKFQRSQCR